MPPKVPKWSPSASEVCVCLGLSLCVLIMAACVRVCVYAYVDVYVDVCVCVFMCVVTCACCMFHMCYMCFNPCCMHYHVAHALYIIWPCAITRGNGPLKE